MSESDPSFKVHILPSIRLLLRRSDHGNRLPAWGKVVDSDEIHGNSTVCNVARGSDFIEGSVAFEIK